MTGRYTAAALDLSLLPAFSLPTPTYAEIRAARLADLRARMVAAGLAVDTLGLPGDPLTILQEEDAYRELIDRQAQNDAAQGMTLQYATGSALDAIAATYFANVGLRRLVVTPATSTAPAVLESDLAFRQRIALAPEAQSAGTLGGYEFWARASSPAVVDALALNAASGLVQPGQILLVVAGAAGTDFSALLPAVRAYASDPSIKLATDDVRIVAATPVAYDVTATLEVLPGPDPSLVQGAALAALQAYAAGRRSIKRRVSASGIAGALNVAAAESVTLAAPTSTVDPGSLGIAELGAVNLSTVLADD